ncbi:MAG: hypothetical protein WCI27_11490, partial [Candidatus Omnitrophota bacterium]
WHRRKGSNSFSYKNNLATLLSPITPWDKPDYLRYWGACCSKRIIQYLYLVKSAMKITGTVFTDTRTVS